MKQITSNVWVETETRGCNFGFVTTADGIVMIDSPHKPTTAIWLKSEIRKRGLLRYIINTEPHGDHWTGNAFFDAPVIAHEGVRTRMLNTDMAEHAARVGTFGPDEPALLEDYTANFPVVTFRDTMTMHVGDHTFEMIHMPGHTLYQAAVIIKEDGVVFTNPLVYGQAADIQVTVSVPGYLDAWFDLNADGTFTQAGDQIFASQQLTAGVNNLSFNLPGITPLANQTFARFRFSTQGGLSHDGPAPSGEVEDYVVNTVDRPHLERKNLDWGDAPDSYDTTMMKNGPRHKIVQGIQLGNG